MHHAAGNGHEQTNMWNGAAGCAWVDEAALLDRIYQPFEDLLVEAAAARRAARILDVGCGTGATTVALARLPAAKDGCIGVDVSAPMIAAARARAEREGSPARFVCADAQAYAFEPAAFDLIVSRFGVMFFDDSAAAFENLRRAAASNAELRFIAWRSAEENPFMTAAERAAAAVLPDLPVRRPDAPGQFAFGDRLRVSRILETSGWTDIDVQPIDVACRFPADALVRYLTRMGPVGRILQTLDEPTRSHIVDVVRPAFDPYVHGAEVRFDAACWMVRARR